MIRNAILVAVFATAGLLYVALKLEPDLAQFERKKLETLINLPRAALPVDLHIEDSRQRFARLIMDYAEHENHRLDTARAMIPGIIMRQTQKKAEKRGTDAALVLLLHYFNIDPTSPLDSIEEQLYLRVDGLPPALVATQAAIESAWGSSRFALEGNNFFGHQCYQKGCGIKPKNSKSASLEVRRFDTIGDSVAAYYQNINTHKAYKATRKIRLALRQQDHQLTTKALIPTLGRYSELGSRYLKILNSVFRSDHIQLVVKQIEAHDGL